VPHIARSIAPAISDVVQAANIPIQSRWLLASGPNPLLAISGEHGSAKTVLSKMLKALIDPNVAPVRALPREERELMIAANNDPLAFDNLSDLPIWLSDALCRLASGGSFAVRQFYTDDDEILFQDLLRAASVVAGDDISKTSASWPKNPGALAGRPRRAQTFLRMLGIEIAFSREGRAATRTIRLSSECENRSGRAVS
jgi:hypothetical protein